MKKAPEAPKKINNPFEKKAEETVIQSSKPVEAPPKKLEAPSVFTQPPQKQVEEKPLPKKLDIPPVVKPTPPVIANKPTPPPPVQAPPAEQRAKVSKLFASDSEDEEEEVKKPQEPAKVAIPPPI